MELKLSNTTDIASRNNRIYVFLFFGFNDFGGKMQARDHGNFTEAQMSYSISSLFASSCSYTRHDRYIQIENDIILKRNSWAPVH